MEDKPESNTDLKSADVFTTVNNYLLLFFCASCLLSSMYLQQLFDLVGYYRAGVGVSALVAMVLPVFLLLRRVGDGFNRQVRLARPKPGRVVLVILATLATVVIVDQIYLITQRFIPVPEQYVESLKDLKPADGFSFGVIFVGLCLLVPVGEELIFRGLIQQIFTRNMGGVAGFLLAGLVFGAIHLNSHLLISISFFGVFLGFVYYATGNLVYSIIAHGLFNTVALIQLTASGTSDASGLPFYLRDVWIFVMSLVLLVYLLVKIKQGGSEVIPPYENKT